MLTILLACLALWFGGSTASPSQALLLVSYSAEDAIGLVDPDKGTAVAKISVGKDPHEITLTRDRSRAYVATTGGQRDARTPAARNTIAVVDLKSRRALAAIDLQSFARPHDVRVSGDGAIAWVACAPAQAIVEVDTRSGRIATVWRTGADGGWFVAVTPDGNKIYVPHLEAKRVSVVDRTRRSVATVLEGGAQSGIDVSPDGKSVWVIDHEGRTINVIDTATDRVTVRVPLRSNDFGRMRFTPDGSRVVVVQGSSMTLIDASTRQVTGEMTLPFAGKVVDLSPSGDRAAVSHPDDDRISIVDLAKHAVVASIPTGKRPDGIAWVR